MTLIGRPPTPLADRLWGRVDRSDPDACWRWPGSKNRSGYGRIQKGVGVTLFAHRVAYELVKGPIPEGFTIDHLCRVRDCINPAHLDAVSPRENVLRGDTVVAANARKTYCKRGHKFTPENTYSFGPDGRHRACHECRRRQQSGIAERVVPFRHRRRRPTGERSVC